MNQIEIHGIALGVWCALALHGYTTIKNAGGIKWVWLDFWDNRTPRKFDDRKIEINNAPKTQ